MNMLGWRNFLDWLLQFRLLTGLSLSACSSPETLSSAFLSMDQTAEQPEAPPPCQLAARTFSAKQLGRPLVSAHETAIYELTLQDDSTRSCPARVAAFVPSVPSAELTVLAEPPFALLPAGRSARFVVAVTASSNLPPGEHLLPFEFSDFKNPGELTGELAFRLNEPSGCAVLPDRELFIRSPSVVDDPVRTSWDPSSPDPRTGAWHLGRLLAKMAPDPEEAAQFVESFLNSWTTDQTVNGFRVPARPSILALLLDDWPRRNGFLDLSQTPARLLTIVNRVDLRSLRAGNAGEGRLVFGFLDKRGLPTQFTLILEYRVPASSRDEVRDWASRWHRLGQLPFPSEQYNAALQELSDEFTGGFVEPSGSLPQIQVRSNEIALDLVWQLRQFSFSEGRLLPTTLDRTPDQSFQSDSALLASFVDRRARAVLKGRHHLPLEFLGVPLRAGSIDNRLDHWAISNLRHPEARHSFALQTCNGCHGSETGTAFLHVLPRVPGESSALSGFLRGMVRADPVTQELRLFNDLGRRLRDLERLVGCRSWGARFEPFLGPAERPATSQEEGIADGLERAH